MPASEGKNNHDGSDSAVASKSKRQCLQRKTQSSQLNHKNIINNNGTERHFLCVREHNEHILDSEMSIRLVENRKRCVVPPQPLWAASLKHIQQKHKSAFCLTKSNVIIDGFLMCFFRHHFPRKSFHSFIICCADAEQCISQLQGLYLCLLDQILSKKYINFLRISHCLRVKYLCCKRQRKFALGGFAAMTKKRLELIFYAWVAISRSELKI